MQMELENIDQEEKKLFCNHLLKIAREMNEREQEMKSGMKQSGFVLEERFGFMHPEWEKLPAKHDFDFSRLDGGEHVFVDIKGCRASEFGGRIFLEIIQNKKTKSLSSPFKKENMNKKITLVFIDFSSGVEYWINDLHKFVQECVADKTLQHGGYNALGISLNPKDYPAFISIRLPFEGMGKREPRKVCTLPDLSCIQRKDLV